MSKLSIDQKNIRDLLKSSFEIPSYQRQYAWEERECSRLWDDLISFAFPDNDCNNFDSKRDEYFLGPIVTFLNDEKQEVIDGHQRLVTLTLLLRSFYKKLSEDNANVKTCNNIETCIWELDEEENPDMNSSKIEIRVVTDDTLEEFRNILRTGEVLSSQKSRYAENYRFFQKRINELSSSEIKSDFALMPKRIMDNCILFPIEANSQDTALQIFSTLNDRGKPLSDSDIFKAHLYEHYDKKTPSCKETFIARWKNLEGICQDYVKIIFPKTKVKTPMDDIFARYMYYSMATQGANPSTKDSVKKFYEKNSYALLKKDETFEDIDDLALFWHDVAQQDKERFSDRVLKRLFILKYSTTDMWANIVSVYYLHNNDDGKLDDEKFYNFLGKITAFILAHSLKRSRDFRSPLYAEMINIVNYSPVEFEKYKFVSEFVRNDFKNYGFTEGKQLTKFMLIWWAFENETQTLLPFNQELKFDCIFSKKSLESRGNRGLLDFEKLGNKTISIREKAGKNFVSLLYHGSIVREDAGIKDLYNVPKRKFQIVDINKRDDFMLEKFIEYLKKNDLIK